MNDQAPPKPDISKVGALTIEDAPDRLRVSIRVVSGWTIFLTPLCVIWNGGVIFAIIRIIQDSASIGQILSTVPFAVIGVLLFYLVVIGIINRTILEATADHLSVRQTPLPWLGSVYLKADDIDQIFYERNAPTLSTGYNNLYALLAATTKGKVVRLMDMLDGTLQAEVIKRKIDQQLGKTGRPPANSPANGLSRK